MIRSMGLCIKLLMGLFFLSSLLVSCGPNVETLPVNKPEEPVNPSLLSTNPMLQHKSYIIAGQSNAVRMLYVTAGINSDVNTYTQDLNPGRHHHITGYGIGGTSISYWLDPVNSEPLKNILRSKCDENPYLVWYQGEADTSPSDAAQYRPKLITFFNEMITTCPNITIVEIGLAVKNSARNSAAWDVIINIQRNLGLPYVDANPYGFYGYYGDNHLVQGGYEKLWDEISTRNPLEGD